MNSALKTTYLGCMLVLGIIFMMACGENTSRRRNDLGFYQQKSFQYDYIDNQVSRVRTDYLNFYRELAQEPWVPFDEENDQPFAETSLSISVEPTGITFFATLPEGTSRRSGVKFRPTTYMGHIYAENYANPRLARWFIDTPSVCSSGKAYFQIDKSGYYKSGNDGQVLKLNFVRQCALSFPRIISDYDNTSLESIDVIETFTFIRRSVANSRLEKILNN